ncbi:MAG: DUF4384 domain-containing protein [Spirochaetes bacterium]|nr:DUF4384 domain-containing protein [Spirochaetota bacterium]
MKRIAVIAALALAAGVALGAEDLKAEFDWAFARRGPEGEIVPLDFSERVGVAGEDLFKIFVRPVGGAFVYVLLLDSSGALDLLFPASFGDFAAAAYAGGHFVPPGDDWFALDGTRGVETFYLVASASRLDDLERLYLAYRAQADNPRSTQAPRARQAVLDELARLRKAHSSLASAAEKPVTIAGGSRSVEAEIQRRATRITAPGFYSRTFRLEH